MRYLVTICLFLACSVAITAQNEEAPILEKDIVYKDWTQKSIRDGKDVNLRDLTKGKKLVAVVYWAPWCHNWQHDAPMLQKLYDKYKDQGFEIVGIGEYGTVDAMKTSLDTFKITFPTVYESQSTADIQKTLHYSYRQTTGDKRKWGSPYYVLLDTKRINKNGDVITEKTDVINGEMIESEGEQFIRQKLKLPPLETKLTSLNQNENEIRDPAKPAELKKH